MLSAIIGAGVGLAGTLVNGISQARQAREAEALRRQQEARELATYNRRYYEDATQRADAVRAMELTRQRVNDRNRAIDGQVAVAGVSAEDAAKAREANNQAISDTTSQINSMGAAQKDKLQDNHQAYNDAMSNLAVEEKHRRMQNTATALSGLFGVAGSIASSGLELPIKPKH